MKFLHNLLKHKKGQNLIDVGRRSQFVLLTLLFTLASWGAAQTIPDGAKVFIAPMENGLDGFIASEIIKRKLPITIVTDENGATYVLAGGSIKADDKWFHTVFGG